MQFVADPMVLFGRRHRRREDLPQRGAHTFQTLTRNAPTGQRSHMRLNEEADLKNLTDTFERNAPDERAPSWEEIHQPFLCQTADRLPHRCPAHSQLDGK